MKLCLGRHATEVRGNGAAGELRLDDGTALAYDRLLVAVGRRARTDGLACAAGIQLAKDSTVVVDDQLRTTNPQVWAAGDVAGPPQFTHTAGVRGSLAASNAILGLRRRVDPVVPRVIYTSPDVAAVGVGATDPLPAGLTALCWEHRHADRVVAEDDTTGFTTLVVDRRGRLVGATVVGPRAGETLGELTLAVRQGLTTRDLAGSTHPYPTYNDAEWNAAVADVRSRLARPPARSMLGAARGCAAPGWITRVPPLCAPADRRPAGSPVAVRVARRCEARESRRAEPGFGSDERTRDENSTGADRDPPAPARGSPGVRQRATSVALPRGAGR